ncbi:M20/M25/M40 family metallo-hydrolase [Sphingoaurantiacus capsulatus]|uniref:M20/M25/M40 family metallo-hydrolase n=1 Tax=Sphingoaurantiacus capsulatus TaxID=1771310 RepID=A0ABV7X963_9SPHN
MKIKALALLAAMTATTAMAQTAPHERQARDIYEKVIAFRTAAGHGQMPKMTDYLVGVLKAGGVPQADIAILPLGETNAMVVRFPAAGKPSKKPILFSAHMDVVDARPEDWTRDPFRLIEENGYFFGRGTSDNKAGVTALVSTIVRLKAEGFKPKRDLVFAFIGDEETLMATTKLVAAHPWVKDAEFAINTDAGGGALDESGKPVIYLVQGAEKTYATFELTVPNPGGHSSRPRSDNAIYDLAAALARLQAYRFPVMANALTRDYLGAVGKSMPGEVGEGLRAFAANPQDQKASDYLATQPEFVGTTRTTCVATMLNAGHAENALPQKATATVNCRIFPDVKVADVQAELARVVANPAIQFKVLNDPQPSPVSEMRPDVMAAITRAIHVDYPGVPIVPYLESGGTDGKIYRIAGIPTFASSGLFTKTSDMFAHGLNERLAVPAFYKGLGHIYRVTKDLGGR